jgi:predicted TIM-barrel fold metal-dependent hydrolase
MDQVSNLPRIVSADDHVVEPPKLWVERLPARYADVAPRVERGVVAPTDVDSMGRSMTVSPVKLDERPVDIWCYEDLRLPLWRTMAAVGYDRDDVTITPITYDEMRPGCFQQGPRLDDMDVNNVDASVCYPNAFVRFCGQTFAEAKDKELALLCVRAYNDWMIEEWAAGSAGRLVPMCIVPLWDRGLAVAEVERITARGVRAVCFSEIPAYLGLPSLHSGEWDPFLAACDANGVVLNMHFGSSSRLATTSDDAPAGVANTLTFVNPAMALADWLLSGILAQFANLKIVFGECNIGWVPYLLERADIVWEQNRGWNEVYDKLPEPPSSYFHRQVLMTFFQDEHGVRSIQEIGIDNVMFETDYPHSDSTWPNSMKFVSEYAEQLSPDVLHRVVRQNAIDLYGIELKAS